MTPKTPLQRALRLGTLAAAALALMGNTECSPDENDGNGDIDVSGIPLADFGDAPDGFPTGYTPTSEDVALSGEFPSAYGTSNSRIGAAGAHALDSGGDLLGLRESREQGVLDPDDSDSTNNMVDDDLHDDGIQSLVALEDGRVTAEVAVTIPSDASPGTRYLNVVVDFDGNGRWENVAGRDEWRVVNLAFEPPVGETSLVSLSDIWPAWGRSEAWTRVVLSRTPVDATLFGELGWDGSGAFGDGEVEDHLLHRPVYASDFDWDVDWDSMARSDHERAEDAERRILLARVQAEGHVAALAVSAAEADALVIAVADSGAAASSSSTIATESHSEAQAAVTVAVAAAAAGASASAASISSASSSSGCATADSYASASAYASADAAASASSTAEASALVASTAASNAAAASLAAAAAYAEAQAHASAFAGAYAEALVALDVLIAAEAEVEAYAEASADAYAAAGAYAEALAEAIALGGMASADAQVWLALYVNAVADVDVQADAAVSLALSVEATVVTMTVSVTEADAAFAALGISVNSAAAGASAAASAAATAMASSDTATASATTATEASTAVAEADSMAIALSTAACETEVCLTYIAAEAAVAADLQVCNLDVQSLDAQLLTCSGDLTTCNQDLATCGSDVAACETISIDCFDSLADIGVNAIDSVVGDWSGADFSNTNLENANFTNANMQGTVLTGANLTGCTF